MFVYVQRCPSCALFCFSSSCVPYAASFSGMSIFLIALRYFPTLVVICTDCTGSLKSNYHAMTTTKAPRCCVDRVVLFLFLLCFVLFCFDLNCFALFCFVFCFVFVLFLYLCLFAGWIFVKGYYIYI